MQVHKTSIFLFLFQFFYKLSLYVFKYFFVFSLNIFCIQPKILQGSPFYLSLHYTMDTKSKNGREKIANFLKFLFFTYIYVFILLNLQIIKIKKSQKYILATWQVFFLLRDILTSLMLYFESV